MGKFIAFFRAAIAAIASFVWVTCKRTGRLVMKMVSPAGAAPTGPSPAMAQAAAATSASTFKPQLKSQTSTEVVRGLAKKMLSGNATIRDMHNVSPAVVQWLGTLDQAQLHRLVASKDLSEFLAGRERIEDLPPYLDMADRLAERRTPAPEFDIQPRLAYPV